MRLPYTMTFPARTLGIIGGLGPESTIIYYRTIVDEYRGRHPAGSSPHLLLASIDLRRLLSQVAAEQFADLTDDLVTEIEGLARAGARTGLLAANTPHVVFDQLAERSPIPLISIVDCACREASRWGLRRLGLLGTRFTMTRDFYSVAFRRAGLEIVAPSESDQRFVHAAYVDELVAGIVRNETRAELLAVIGRMRRLSSIDGIVLGGTELGLILSENDTPDFPLIDTTRVHASAAVTWMLE